MKLVKLIQILIWMGLKTIYEMYGTQWPMRFSACGYHYHARLD